MRILAHIEADAIALKWDELISTSYRVLGAAQSNTTGLFVNWVELSDTSDLRSGAKTSKACADETPPAEFGAQAARVAWRLFLDEAWFGEGPATELLRPLTLHVASKLRFADERCTQVSCNAELGLDEGEPSLAIFLSWTEEPFITGFVAAALTVPAEGSDGFERQQAADDVGRLVHQQHYTMEGGWTPTASAGRRSRCFARPRPSLGRRDAPRPRARDDARQEDQRREGGLARAAGAVPAARLAGAAGAAAAAAAAAAVANAAVARPLRLERHDATSLVATAKAGAAIEGSFPVEDTFPTAGACEMLCDRTTGCQGYSFRMGAPTGADPTGATSWASTSPGARTTRR